MKRMIFSSVLAIGLLSLPVFAQSVTNPNPNTIKLCTGADGGAYKAIGGMIQNFAPPDFPIDVIETTGTSANMDATILGACDAMLGQPDGPVFLKRAKPADAAKLSRVMKLHREYLQVLCSKESGITDLKELTSEHTVAIGSDGSGAWLIWQNFIEQDSSYADIKVTSDSGILAVNSVAANEITCLIVTAGVPNGTISEADANFGDSVVLVSATDKDFNDATDIDGKGLYTWGDLPTANYPVTFNRYWGDIETITWNAGLYVNKQRLNGKRLETFVRAATRARPTILSTYGQ